MTDQVLKELIPKEESKLKMNSGSKITDIPSTICLEPGIQESKISLTNISWVELFTKPSWTPGAIIGGMPPSQEPL